MARSATFFFFNCRRVWRAQEFIDDLDAMPSITMENNVIHNNEGYGVIVVKPSSHEEWRVSVGASEGMWR